MVISVRVLCDRVLCGLICRVSWRFCLVRWFDHRYPHGVLRSCPNPVGKIRPRSVLSSYFSYALKLISFSPSGRYSLPLKVAYISIILGNILHAVAYKANFLYLILMGRIVSGLGFTGFLYSKRYCSGKYHIAAMLCAEFKHVYRSPYHRNPPTDHTC
jgi:hypothetical protein